MAEPKTVVFMYPPRHVTPAILEMAKARVSAGLELELLPDGSSAEERLAKIASSTVIFSYMSAPSEGELAAAKKLRLLQLLSAGHDWLDLAAFKRAGILTASIGEANAPTVAEHTILLILAIYKKLILHYTELRAGRWLGMQEAIRMHELRGKKVGIIGFGRIGRELARLARGFQATVRYNDIVRAPAAIEKEVDTAPVAFDDILRDSDVVTIHTPLTPQTQGFIDARALGLMKSSAILINTSRGPVIDEPALVSALQQGRIAGAGLDVFTTEPLPGDSPLLTLPNVVVTTHIAGSSRDSWSRRLEFAFGNARRVLAGLAPDSAISDETRT